MNKHLVYLSIFFSQEYIEMFKLLLITMKTFSKTDTFDLLVLTSEEFEPHISKLSDVFHIPIKTMCLNCKTPEEASSARLHIFEYEGIDTYTKLLYIDTDILIQNDLATFFDCDIDDKLYALEEYGYITDEWFGGWFYDFTKFDKNIHGFNAGVLLFQNTHTMKNLFNNVIQSICDFKQNTRRGMPLCWEQPFLNYHAIRNNLFDGNLMHDYVYIFGYHNPDAFSDDGFMLQAKNKTNIINHITVGNKFPYLEYFISILIDNFIDTRSSNEISLDIILNKSYIWENGTIQFLKDNVLRTPWGTGQFKLLTAHIAEISWDNNRYCVVFDKQLEKYVSMKLGDRDIVSGVLIRSE